jgi:hypothetical protein
MCGLVAPWHEKGPISYRGGWSMLHTTDSEDIPGHPLTRHSDYLNPLYLNRCTSHSLLTSLFSILLGHRSAAMGSSQSKVPEAAIHEKLVERLQAMQLHNEMEIVEDYIYIKGEARK